MTSIGLITSSDIQKDPGGVTVSTLRLMRGLMARGFEVHLLSLQKRQQEGTERITFWRTTPPEQTLGGAWLVGPIAQCGGSVERARQLREFLHATESWVRAVGPDLLMAMYAFPAGYGAVYAQERCDVPALVCVRGNDVGRDLVNARISPFISHALTRAAGVTFVSRRLRDFALALVSLPSDPYVIWNSVDISEFDLSASPNNKQNACLHGRLVEKKGIDLLLEAFETPPLADSAVKLDLIGDFSESTYRRELESRFAVLRERDRVVVSGWLPRAEALTRVANSNCVVVPSVDDGCPNSLLEAFALGLPTFGSAILAEFFPPTARELLFNGQDLGSLARLIHRACNNRAFAAEVGRELQAWCSGSFSLDSELNAYCRVFRELT
jgi:glycosyltransferase involved in cell wall biosynthesis